jgi:allophanate hydrolase subunit 1
MPDVDTEASTFSRDLIEELIAKRRKATPKPASPSARIPARVYGIMGLTTTMTFATLTTGYQLFFTHPLFA